MLDLSPKYSQQSLWLGTEYWIFKMFTLPYFEVLHPELELIGSITDLDLVVSYFEFAEALEMDIVCAVCYVEFVVFILALNFAFGFSPDSVSFSETEDMPNNDGSKNSFVKVKIRDLARVSAKKISR